MSDIYNYYMEDMDDIISEYENPVDKIEKIIKNEKSGKKLIYYLLFFIDGDIKNKIFEETNENVSLCNLEMLVKNRLELEKEMHNKEIPSIYFFLIRGIRDGYSKEENLNILSKFLKRIDGKLLVCPRVFGIITNSGANISEYLEPVNGFSVCGGSGDPEEIFENGGMCPI